MRRFDQECKGFRRLDFGGDKTEYLFAGGFALVILLALGFTVKHYVFSGPSGGGAGDDGLMHFECVECGHQFTRKGAELSEQLRYEGEGPEEIAIDCPECNARMSALVMTRCPECGKYYLPDWKKDYGSMEEGRGEYVCPHCGTNRAEYYREKYQNQ